jgi:hypothetical protein
VEGIGRKEVEGREWKEGNGRKEGRELRTAEGSGKKWREVKGKNQFSKQYMHSQSEFSKVYHYRKTKLRREWNGTDAKRDVLKRSKEQMERKKRRV